MGVDGEHIAVL